MKAAVLHEAGGIPRYEDFPDPVANEDEVVVEVRAVAVENVDKAVAAGTHFASLQFMPQFPAIPCFDGIGVLPDGTVVGFGQPRPPYGALAERTVVARSHVVPMSEGLDPAVAVVIGSAITGFAVKTAADLKPGETVLIQGATGVAGRLSIQVARLLGAGRIIATGRDDDALKELAVDTTINTAVSDDELARAYAEAAPDVVLDFLWGRPTEVLLTALTPDEIRFAKPVRLVQVGESAGPALTLTAASLRTSGVEIYGAAKGLDATTMADAYQQVVKWTVEEKLTFDLERVSLQDIEAAWQRKGLRGRRLVVLP